jgi:NDP-sugar pyrophosphorylase family protein
MRALLLAAGLGTRLRPFTFNRAKAALPLLNVPFIQYPLQCLSSKGITEIVINLHAHPESVKAAAGSEYAGIPIHFSHEPQILGTGGAIRKAKNLLEGGPFLVMNSDMLCDPPLDQMREQHRQTGSLVTLMVMRGEKFEKYGRLPFDRSEIPRLLPPGANGEKLHYTGIQIVSPEVFSHIPEEKKTEIFTDIYPQLSTEGKISAFLYDGIWMEIGNLTGYLNTALQLQEKPLSEHLQPKGMESSNISSRAHIEDGARISGSIVMEGAEIKSEAQVEHSIIGWDVILAKPVQNVALAKGMLPWYFKPHE